MQNKLSSLLMKTRSIPRSSVLWNAVSACLTSFQTMLLLMVLTRFGTSEHSGYFVMAYTVANLMMNIGKFGMRQFQVTDAKGKYSFREYIASRVFSSGLMALALLLYLLWGLLFNGYTAEKAAAVALISLFRGVEAAEDVLHGHMQQQGRLDVASKILAVRNAVFILGFALLYLLTRNLVFTCAVNAAITLLLCFVMNRAVLPAFREETDNRPADRSRRIPKALLLECLPLCLTMVTYMYLGNAPKYIVDGLVTEEVQTCFNIVIMPAFVVSLLCTFIFNPVLKKIGVLWQDGEVQALRRLVRRLALAPVGVDAALLLGGYFLGLPILSAVYHVDLTGYRPILMIFLLASGAVAMLNLFVALLTAMRKQRHLLYAYAAASLLLLLAGRRLFAARGLQAVCLLYLAVLLAVLAYCVLVYLRTVAHSRKKEGTGGAFRGTITETDEDPEGRDGR